MKLAKELVQPVLDLHASPDCPKHLLSIKGRPPIHDEKRLLGKLTRCQSVADVVCAVRRFHLSVGRKKTLKHRTFA